MPPKLDENKSGGPPAPPRTQSRDQGGDTEGQDGGLDLTTGGPQPPPPLNPNFQPNTGRPPERTPPGEEIEFADITVHNENIYDHVRSKTNSDNSTEGSHRGSDFDSVVNSVAGLSTDEKDRLFKSMQAERNQSMYPTALLNQEMSNIDHAISDNEENVDLITHKLQTVQSKRDDYNEAAQFKKLQAESAIEEEKISEMLNVVKLKQIQLERTKKEMQRIQRGESQDGDDIGKVIRISQGLTSSTPSGVLYSTIKKNKKVNIKDEDDESSEEYEDATEGESSDEELEETPKQTPKTKKGAKVKIEKKKSKTKKAKKSSSSNFERPPTPVAGARGSGNPGDSSSSSSSEDEESDEEELSREKVPKFAKVLWTLEEIMENAQKLLDSEEQNKVKFSITMDELKNSLKMAREARINWNPPTKDMGKRMKKKIKTTGDLISQIADHIEKINNNEALRKMLPSGSWPKWNGSAEDFLEFIQTMKVHLPTLQTDKLQLTTLKDHMVGQHMKTWIRNNLTGVTTLNQAFKILEEKFGDITRQLPTKLDRLDKLKTLQSEPTDPVIEHENVTALLNYCRTCVEYGAELKVDSLFLLQYENLLSNTTRLTQLSPLAVAENWDEQREIAGPLISFLETHQTNLERLDCVRRHLQKSLEKTNSKSHKQHEFSGKLNNGNWHGGGASSTRGDMYCLICSSKGHSNRYPNKCPNLSKLSNLEQKMKYVSGLGKCTACLGKWGKENHQCSPGRRKFYCERHKCNVGICQCSPIKSNNEPFKPAGITEGKVTNNSVQMNTTQNGLTTTSLIFEIVYFLDDKGKEHPVIQVYDNGNSNMAMDSSLPNKLLGFVPYTHNMQIENFASSTATRKRGNRRTMKLKTIDGVEEITVFAFSSTVNAQNARRLTNLFPLNKLSGKQKSRKTLSTERMKEDITATTSTTRSWRISQQTKRLP